jgi:Pentapeptide repeats (8 copies)
MAELPLTADCTRCAALCCVAPAFAVSADFAIDKPAGRPCPHLQASFRCGIHATLRERGFPGCAAYDCFGAGQHVVQETVAGRDWRDDPSLAREMFDVFARMRELHELLWHLREAEPLAMADERDTLAAATQATERLARSDAQTIVAADLSAHRMRVLPVLRRVSAHARAGIARPADLAGADLTGRDLRGADLRSARLVGSNLRDSDLTLADVTGADLRGAELGGADLRTTLFLTQPQIDGARGNAATVLPPTRLRPTHWRG